MVDRYGEKNSNTALRKLADGKYQIVGGWTNFVVSTTLGAKGLTDEQKQDLLFNVFGLTEDQVNSAINSDGYR